MKEIKEKLLKYTETLIDFCKFQVESAIDPNPVFKINAADATLCFEEATKELNQALQTAIPQWQPIETAPKDGSLMLVFVNKDIYVMGWLMANWREPANMLVPKTEPTHWMPLPPPPTTTEVSL